MCVCVCVWMGTVCLIVGREVREAGEVKDGRLDDAGISAFHATASLVCTCWGLGGVWWDRGRRWKGVDRKRKGRSTGKNTQTKFQGKTNITRRMGAAGGITNGSREVVGRGSPQLIEALR